MWRLSSLALLLFACITKASDVEVINKWNLLNFNFPYDYDFLNAFRPENTVFTGLEVTHDRIFLAVPRLRVGVPATVATIPRNSPPQSSPVLQAYPDWSQHETGKGGNASCDGLVSVYRLKADSCNRLWVLDSGVMTSLDDFRVVCPPKIVIFDLRTDQIVRTVVFPREVLRPASLLTNLVIDETLQGACDDALVYMTDTAAPGLVVYDSAKDRTWRVMHPTMFPDPDFSDYTVDGETFTLMDGIIGVAHAPSTGTLYYQPLATDRIFSVSTQVISKGPLAEGEVLPVTLVGRKASQGIGLAVDLRDESLYFSPIEQTSLASWNPKTNQQKLLAYDLQQLQFPTEVRWIGLDGGIWALTTRFQKFFKRAYNNNEVNLRIIRVTPYSRPVYPVNNNIYLKK